MREDVMTENPGLGPHHVELKTWISCAPFEELLGLRIVEAKDGRSLLTMPFVFRLAQGAGLAHGGAIVTLADTAVAMAVKSILPPDSRFGTIKLSSEFLRPVTKGILTAKAEVTPLENRMVEGNATVFDGDENPVMTFTAIFKLARGVELLNR